MAGLELAFLPRLPRAEGETAEQTQQRELLNADRAEHNRWVAQLRKVRFEAATVILRQTVVTGAKGQDHLAELFGRLPPATREQVGRILGRLLQGATLLDPGAEIVQPGGVRDNGSTDSTDRSGAGEVPGRAAR